MSDFIGRGTVLGFLSVLAMLTPSLPAQTPARPLAVPPIEYEKETLDNGLRVIYAPLRQAPVVHVRVLYHVGSRDERPDRQGFAHMFEHMMFRGSAHVPSEQHMKLINIVGGNSNAFTSFDQTTYINTIPSNSVEMALYLEADRMAGFKVNDDVFHTERNVVHEEWRMRYGNQPLGTLSQDFFRTVYKNHNYRWTPIGDMDQLKQSTSSELQEFFNTYYVPNNACLIVAGDIDIAKTRQWVRSYFGWIPRGAEIKRVTPAEPEQTEPRRLVVTKPNVPLTNMYLGFVTPDYQSDDHFPLWMLGDILSSGSTGRLNRKFVNGDDPSCLRVGAGDDVREDSGLFLINAVVQQGKDPDQVEKDLLATAYDIAANGVTMEELEKVRTQARQGLIEARETCTQIAEILGEEEVFGGNAARANEMLARLNAVTPESVQAVAKKFLQPQRLNSVHYRPGPAAAPATPIVAAAPVAPIAAIEPRVKSFPNGYPTNPPFNVDPIKVTFNKGVEQMVDGVRVLTLTDTRLPLVNVTLVMPGGSDAEPRDKTGIGGMTATMMRRGSAGISFLDFASDLESRGISINAGDGSDNTRLTIDCTTDQLDYAITRANHVLTKPDFPQEEFDKFKSQSIGGLLQALSNPATVAQRELAQALYAGGTLARVTTQKSLESITLDDVKKWYETYFQLTGAMLLISGDVTPEQSAGLATKLLAGLSRRQKPAPANYAMDPAPTKRKFILVDNPAGKQSSIRLGIRAYDVHADTEKFAGSVAGSILSSGIEGRLNRYVRAEKGLTYGASSYFRPSRHAGEFSGSVDTNPDTTAATVEAMIKVFNDMRSAPVTDVELAEAKTRTNGAMVMEMQTISQQAGRRLDQILNEYPIDYWDNYPLKISAVTREQIQQVMQKYAKDDAMIFVVVGPASVVKPQLDALGEVDVLKMPLERQAP